MRQRYLLVALFSTLLIGFSSWFWAQASHSQVPPGRSFEFALIGDLPYNDNQVTKFGNLIDEINQDRRVSFIIHDGDFKSGSSLCSDEMFTQRKQLFDKFEHPFIFIPGDNEWTDCHRANNGNYDPLERLAKIRELYTQGNRSLGRPTLRLSRQSDNPQYIKFRENVRWNYGDVLFLGLNIPGSNNNFGRTSEADAEFRERNAANLAWLRQGFAIAKRNRYQGIMLVIQANPNFDLEPTDKNRTGYNDFIAALEAETRAFAGQVVLVHGDSHYFRIDKPLPRFSDTDQVPRLENFTRVETFGSPNVHWLLASIDPANPNLFAFKQMLIEKNRSDARP